MSVKYLYLVRHGQYDMDKNSSGYGTLNQMGRFQSECVAKRLVEYPITKIFASTVVRAQQTSEIVSKAFPNLEVNNHNLLKEGIPFVHPKTIKKKNMNKAQIKSDLARMENAYNTFFVPNQKNNEKHELLICHGNIIRYFICRCLNVPIQAWSNFEIFECSLSVVKITDKGRIVVNSVGEAGHIPLIKRTVL